MTESTVSVDSTATNYPEFKLPIRVYYEDTDAGGVVYHSNYINYFERARTEWLRDLGFEQDALLDEHKLLFIVRSVSCEYLLPAKFNDELFATVAIRELGKTRITFHQQVKRVTNTEQEKKQGNYVVLAEGNVTVVTVDADKLKPTRIPAFIFEQIAK